MPSASASAIGEQLHRFGLARDRFRAAICRSTGLAERELDALEYLERDGPLTQRELGERLSLTSGGVTLLIDRLERAGWVRRTPHPADRRAVLLELTEEAIRAQPPALDHYHRAVAAAARAIPPEHVDAVADFLANATAPAAEGAAVLRTSRAKP